MPIAASRAGTAVRRATPPAVRNAVTSPAPAAIPVKPAVDSAADHADSVVAHHPAPVDSRLKTEAEPRQADGSTSVALRPGRADTPAAPAKASAAATMDRASMLHAATPLLVPPEAMAATVVARDPSPAAAAVRSRVAALAEARAHSRAVDAHSVVAADTPSVVAADTRSAEVVDTPWAAVDTVAEAAAGKPLLPQFELSGVSLRSTGDTPPAFWGTGNRMALVFWRRGGRTQSDPAVAIVATFAVEPCTILQRRKRLFHANCNIRGRGFGLHSLRTRVLSPTISRAKRTRHCNPGRSWNSRRNCVIRPSVIATRPSLATPEDT